MARKPRKYNKLKSIKEIARDRVGPPPKSRPLTEHAQRDKPKHKKPIGQTGDDLSFV